MPKRPTAVKSETVNKQGNKFQFQLSFFGLAERSPKSACEDTHTNAETYLRYSESKGASH